MSGAGEEGVGASSVLKASDRLTAGVCKKDILVSGQSGHITPTVSDMAFFPHQRVVCKTGIQMCWSSRCAFSFKVINPSFPSPGVNSVDSSCTFKMSEYGFVVQ